LTRKAIRRTLSIALDIATTVPYCSRSPVDIFLGRIPARGGKGFFV
jgi:hypothetical protein